MEEYLRKLTTLIVRLKQAQRDVAYWNGVTQPWNLDEAEAAPKKLRDAEVALLSYLTSEATNVSMP